MTAVADATYSRVNPTDDWWRVHNGERAIGEIWKTRKGYVGKCFNSPKTIVGPTKRKEELGQLILSKWEALPNE